VRVIGSALGELAQLRGVLAAGVGPQLEGDAACVAHGLEAVLRHADRDLELLAARQLHHALALRQHLADLGDDRGDDARGVGMQLGVGEVVLGGGELAPGLIDLGQRRRRQRLPGVERLGHEGGAAAELLVAVEVGLGTGIVGLGGGERGARIVDREPIVGGIDACQELARLHDGADIDLAAGHLAGDAEAQRGLDARHHRAGQHQAAHMGAVLDFDDAGRPHGLLAHRGAPRALPGEGAERHQCHRADGGGGQDGLAGEKTGEAINRKPHGGHPLVAAYNRLAA